jgi:PAS domain S-box-containing protein
MTSPRKALSPEIANETSPIRPYAHVRPEYSAVLDMDRKYVDVSERFCKLLGYRRDELIGKKYDDLTVPHTNDIPIVFRLFTDAGYMHGIWILAHRGGTRPLIRYEAWIRRSFVSGSTCDSPAFISSAC